MEGGASPPPGVAGQASSLAWSSSFPAARDQPPPLGSNRGVVAARRSPDISSRERVRRVLDGRHADIEMPEPHQPEQSKLINRSYPSLLNAAQNAHMCAYGEKCDDLLWRLRVRFVGYLNRTWASKRLGHHAAFSKECKQALLACNSEARFDNHFAGEQVARGSPHLRAHVRRGSRGLGALGKRSAGERLAAALYAGSPADARAISKSARGAACLRTKPGSIVWLHSRSPSPQRT